MRTFQNISIWFNKFLDGIPRQKATWLDVTLLSIFTIFITFQPYYAHGKINFFETGLYLPGVNAILRGEMPYRDFYHLRGPLELYPVAWLMQIFGVHINVLYTYFYVGNILCLIFGIIIAKELFSTRLMLYLFTFPFIGRTFIRVVYAFWGGMRYTWGLVSAFCVIRYFKTRKVSWIFGAGVTTALGSLTSIEIGVYTFLGVLVAFICAFKVMEKKDIFKAAGWYLVGLAVLGVPYLIYLISHNALWPYIDSILGTVIDKERVIDPHLNSTYPRNFIDAFWAMINPNSINFKHMTPSYMYISLLGYLVWRLRAKKFQSIDLCLVFLGVFGFIMYNTGFRGIWAAQFEMALMPEKILYFFLLEVFLLYCLAKRSWLMQGAIKIPWKLIAINVFVIGLIAASVGYGIQRYNSRFFTFKYLRNTITGKDTAGLKPMAQEPAQELTIDRARGILVPQYQAKEIEDVVSYLLKNSTPQDYVFAYPDLGNYNFFADRPFAGWFSLATFSWIKENWFQEFIQELEMNKVKFVILQQTMSDDWKQVYLGYEANRKKHQAMLDFVYSKYELVHTTPQSYIFQLKAQ